MHLHINTPKASFSLTHIATFRRINGSSVKCLDAFPIALMKEPSLLIKQKRGYPFIILFHGKPFPFKTSKIYRQEHEKSLHNFK